MVFFYKNSKKLCLCFSGRCKITHFLNRVSCWSFSTEFSFIVFFQLFWWPLSFFPRTGLFSEAGNFELGSIGLKIHDGLDEVLFWNFFNNNDQVVKESLVEREVLFEGVNRRKHDVFPLLNRYTKTWKLMAFTVWCEDFLMFLFFICFCSILNC